jgi:hypothetical protein
MISRGFILIIVLLLGSLLTFAVWLANTVNPGDGRPAIDLKPQKLTPTQRKDSVSPDKRKHLGKG